jgi:hypothetical protein
MLVGTAERHGRKQEQIVVPTDLAGDNSRDVRVRRDGKVSPMLFQAADREDRDAVVRSLYFTCSGGGKDVQGFLLSAN